jgi:transposase
MPAKRELTMRQLRYMLRLHHDGVSARAIGRALGVARSTIQDNLRRAQASGIAWPLPAELTDDVLEQRLFARPGTQAGLRRRSEPDWQALARELKRPGVNLMVLWEEYRQSELDGYGYSRFCDLFREFERRLSPVMRQHHVAGDKVFVDYSGKRVAIVHPGTGVVHDAELFVGVLGASSYTYAEATFTQTLPDWIGAHVRMFRFFGGVPRLIVPDNLKSGVHKARRYGGRRHGTDPEHMPSSHRRYAEWTPDRFRRWARSIGSNTEALIAAILTHRPHPEQGFRTCLGILRLYRGITPARAEAVSARALEIGAMNYKSVASILANNLDRVAARQSGAEPTLFDHPNVRGPRYFN